jgi:hypothetical protein
LICPKCQFAQPDGGIECSRCGIVFAKYGRTLDKQGMEPQPHAVRESSRDGKAALPAIAQVPVLLLLIYVSWRLIPSAIASNAPGHSFMHLINLPFHEAGHVFFRFFGRFIHSLGGSLGQLLMPLICFIALKYKTRDDFGAAVCLWWFGENFVDMAPYMNDARSLSLPLIGGNFGHSSPYGFHDWQFMLTESGLLRYDHAIARTSHGIGACLMLAGLVWGAVLMVRQWKADSR